MKHEKILSGIHADDVVTVINKLTHKTFCVSQFREIINTAFIAMENAYATSLQSQGHPLPTEWKSSGDRQYPGYDNWFEAGTNCKMLRLGDPKWTQGKMRIRVEMEFVPDNEEDSDQTNESSLDEIRNSIELS